MICTGTDSKAYVMAHNLHFETLVMRGTALLCDIMMTLYIYVMAI